MAVIPANQRLVKVTGCAYPGGVCTRLPGAPHGTIFSFPAPYFSY